MQPINGVVFTLDGLLIGAGDVGYLAWAMFVSFGAVRPRRRWPCSAHRPRDRVAVGRARPVHGHPGGDARRAVAQRRLGRHRRHPLSGTDAAQEAPGRGGGRGTAGAGLAEVGLDAVLGRRDLGVFEDRPPPARAPAACRMVMEERSMPARSVAYGLDPCGVGVEVGSTMAAGTRERNVSRSAWSRSARLLAAPRPLAEGPAGAPRRPAARRSSRGHRR